MLIRGAPKSQLNTMKPRSNRIVFGQAGQPGAVRRARGREAEEFMLKVIS